MIKILFVCMGNICRSPVAEGILRAKLLGKGLVEGEDFIVDSAGTAAWTGSPPDHRSQTVCKDHGIDISTQQGRLLVGDNGKEFDLILCMDSRNIERAKQIISPKYHSKVRLLDTKDVEDPYSLGHDGFEQMYEQLESSIDRLITEIVH